MKYTPDNWIVVEIQQGVEVYHAVLAGWRGGYGDTDSWKLSSGIVYIMEVGNDWYIQNYSGSVYVCNKKCETLSVYTNSIYNHYHKQAVKQKDSFKQVPLVNILPQYTQLENTNA